MAKKFIPAWQRTVLAALGNVPRAADGCSAWEGLNQEEKQAVLGFIAARNGDDADKAQTLLQETLPRVKIHSPRPLGLTIALVAAKALVAVGAAVLLILAAQVRLLFAVLAVQVVVEIIGLLRGAKASRMARRWEQRDGSLAGTEKALKAMYYTALRSPVAAVSKVRIALALVMLLVFGMLTVLPDPGPAEAKLLADRVGEVAAGKAVLADTLALLADAEQYEGLELIQQAMRYTAYGSDEQFLLAALMGMHIEDNAELKLSSYAGGMAGNVMYWVLDSINPTQIDNPEEIAALQLMLGSAGGETEPALRRFLKQKTLPEGVLYAFGAAMRTERTAQEMIALSDEVAAAGHDPLPFLQAALEGTTYAGAEVLIIGAEDDVHRVRLIKACAPAITDPDEVLAYIRLAGSYGVSAVECYPEGAALTWDTSDFDPASMADGVVPRENATFLIIRRTEQPEPYETLVVDPENDWWETDPYGLRWLNYDADPEAACTVTLDTFLMSILPQERIPQTLADCDVLVIADLYYGCEGAIRFTRTSYRAPTMNTYDGTKWGETAVDTPIYSALHNVSLYNMAQQRLVFSYADKVIEAPYHTQGHELHEATSMADWNALELYLPETDHEWLDDAAMSLVDTLRRKEWDAHRITIKYLWKD